MSQEVVGAPSRNTQVTAKKTANEHWRDTPLDLMARIGAGSGEGSRWSFDAPVLLVHDGRNQTLHGKTNGGRGRNR
ncbi:MAG: hypothetical protein ACRD1D_09265 [Acidimicrobiales bacterium]